MEMEAGQKRWLVLLLLREISRSAKEKGDMFDVVAAANTIGVLIKDGLPPQRVPISTQVNDEDGSYQTNKKRKPTTETETESV